MAIRIFFLLVIVDCSEISDFLKIYYSNLEKYIVVILVYVLINYVFKKIMNGLLHLNFFNKVRLIN